MKKLTIISCLLFVMAVGTAFTQDNPLPFGTAGNNNARTYVYQAPYIFGPGTTPVVKWKVQLDVAPLSTRRNAWHNITFDDQGGLYFRGAPNAAVTDYGIVKLNANTGAKLWYNPAVADVSFHTGSAIVGQEAVYASRYDAANPTVYALDKNTGGVMWQSAALPMSVALNMNLYNGVLYGMTKRDANGFSHAFSINATTGAILQVTPIATTGDVDYGNTAFAPNVFGPGEHGLYWFHDNNGTGEAMYGVAISTTGAAKAWAQTPVRSYPSHPIYNAETNSVYALHWADYGTAVESYDPVTGAKKWVASPNGDPNLGFPGGFNGGFYPTHTLKPDGTGFIFAGFGGDIFSVTDPGDLLGAALTMNANGDWYYDGADYYGESQTMAVTIQDPVTGRWILISGTSANAENPHVLYAQDLMTGARLWEWATPGDVSPNAGAFNYRALSIGPDGCLYYEDANEGPMGTLYCIGSVVIPEPGTILMIVSGLFGMLFMFRKKK
jgi:hypothetical protein